jgi:hypothetical protein
MAPSHVGPSDQYGVHDGRMGGGLFAICDEKGHLECRGS